MADGGINFAKRWQQFNILDNMKRFKKAGSVAACPVRLPSPFSSVSVCDGCAFVMEIDQVVNVSLNNHRLYHHSKGAASEFLLDGLVLVALSRLTLCPSVHRQYQFKTNDRILSFFDNFDKSFTEERMWEISESIKPRGRAKKT